MSGIIAIGAAVAVITGIGAGIGIGMATSKQLMQSQDSLRQTVRSQRLFCWDVPLQRLLQFMVLLSAF